MVLCQEGIEHVSDQRGVFEEFARVLKPGGRGDVYLGHVFLIGIQRLRLLARLAGFRIKQVHHLRASKASVLLLLLLYPLIVVNGLLTYWRALRKAGPEPEARRAVYREQLALGLDPRILVDCHLFVEFELDPASRPGGAPAAQPSSSR